MHAIVYSQHAQEMRDFFATALGLRSVDAGEGWPIFAAPPTELAVHPTDERAEHELFLICDDVHATVEQLAEHGVKSAPIQDRSWGLVTSLDLPGGETIGLYEPRHPRP